MSKDSHESSGVLPGKGADRGAGNGAGEGVGEGARNDVGEGIGEACQQLFVLGHPVAHSKSPAMHNAAYQALGLNWSYDFADCPTEAEARAFLSRDDWLGINITMPYKPHALVAATWRSAAAQLAGGANVLVRRGDDLLADNTDGKGCVTYLQRCDVHFEGARAVVCGTGPTSVSIMHAVAEAGASRVTLLGRSAQKARRVLDDYRECAAGMSGELAATSFIEFIAGSYEENAEDIATADIVLDATPLGMKSGDPAPFNTDLLRPNQVVFDVVYAHGVTALLAAAQKLGCATFDGSGMLVAQAVETVYDLVNWLDIPVQLDDTDLFSIMLNAQT